MVKKFIKESFKSHIVPIAISCSLIILSVVCMIVLPDLLCKNVSVENVEEDYSFSSSQTAVICSKIQYSEDFSLKTAYFKDLSSNRITSIKTDEEYIVGETYLANNFMLTPILPITVGKVFKSTIIDNNTTTSIEQLAEEQYSLLINQAVEAKIRAIKDLTIFIPMNIIIGLIILLVVIICFKYTYYKYEKDLDDFYEKNKKWVSF